MIADGQGEIGWAGISPFLNTIDGFDGSGGLKDFRVGDTKLFISANDRCG